MKTLAVAWCCRTNVDGNLRTMGIRSFSSSGRAHRANASALRFGFLAFVLGVAALLSACGGNDPVPEPPAGLGYAMTSAVYEVGQPIVANRPSSSGGAVARYSVEPALPAGLSVDGTTGVISGTPTAIAAAAVHTVTAENAGGRATARVQIEVRQAMAKPAGLTYTQLNPTYTVGEALVPNAPSSSGGPITAYSIAPALPPGLLLDPSTGVISGTPTAIAAASDYVVTGTNLAGATQVTLTVAVQSAEVAPVSLAYGSPVALYMKDEPIEPNAAQVTGGPAAGFSVSPALPAGLSLNTATGAITGTPTTLQMQAAYAVTASNSAGSVQAQVRITVTSRGSWTAAASLLDGRHYAQAVKLNDGRVLLIGGYTSGGATASAEIYDPSFDTWTPAAPMLQARSEPTATLLADGRVLVAGGNQGSSLSSAEIYDPIANTWTATGSMSAARTRHSATRLPHGGVLVIGGHRTGGGTTFSQTAERYDPTTGTWTLMATQLSTPRSQHGAELLPDNSAVLLIGGVNGSSQLTSAELYPVDGSSSIVPVAGAVPPGNVYVSARLADGSILALADTSTTSVRFHPATSSWTTSTIANPSARSLPTMTTLADGRVLLAGGFNLATAEIYNPDLDIWTTAAAMPTVHRAASAVGLDDGSVLVMGGVSGSTELSSVDRFTP